MEIIITIIICDNDQKQFVRDDPELWEQIAGQRHKKYFPIPFDNSFAWITEKVFKQQSHNHTILPPRNHWIGWYYRDEYKLQLYLVANIGTDNRSVFYYTVLKRGWVKRRLKNYAWRNMLRLWDYIHLLIIGFYRM